MAILREMVAAEGSGMQGVPSVTLPKIAWQFSFYFMVDFVDHKDLHISHGYEIIDGDCQDSNDIQQCISPFINSRHFTVH